MRILPALLVALAASPALAQEIAEPRYEALEQQMQTLEQRRFDNLEQQRVNEQMRALTNPNVSSAQSAQRLLEIDRERDRMLLQAQQDRMQVERQRIIADSNLPNRRISPASTLVVTQPELYGLQKLPSNKYYARVEGRFVVVDRASELVEKVLPVQPTDPTADVPAGPLPMPLPSIPVAEMQANGLPAPPPGQYYARFGGSYLLVEQSTARILKSIPRRS